MMELFNARRDGTTVFVDGYDELIWAERFEGRSDFVLTSTNVNRFFNMLRYKDVLYVKDSTTPMLIEKKEIIRRKNEPPQIRVTGHCLKTLLARRSWFNPADPSKDWMVPFYFENPSIAAYVAIWIVIKNGEYSPHDIIPDSLLTVIEPPDFGLSSPDQIYYWMKRGTLLDSVEDVLKQHTDRYARRGLRAIRPRITPPTFGGYALEFFEPVDRSDTVVFYTTLDAFDDGTYSFDDSKMLTSLYYNTPTPTPGVFQKDGHELTGVEGAYSSGWDRNTLYFDGAQYEQSAAQIRNSAEPSAAKLIEGAVLFDGTINPRMNKYIYGVDYDLGDLVGFQGDYGIKTAVRVNEYIRVHDALGSRSYPTFANIDPNYIP